METVTISARISAKKKTEFFQTTEALKSIINQYCNNLEIKIDPQNNLNIRIDFEGKDQLENYFHKDEFNILKGSVKSLCEDVEIKIGDVPVS